ncbi:transposase, mutator family [Rickettsia endosymbiont of Ixodes scapularis]|nr:transposase, mutator family [Rickettsia endosymbiont of Ixodes scapularis]
MQYPDSIRKIIYTTNAIESLNSQLRKVTKNKHVFPNDDAVFKILYLTIDYITKNGLCQYQIGTRPWLIF